MSFKYHYVIAEQTPRISTVQCGLCLHCGLPMESLRTVFVSSLSPSVTDHVLKDAFSAAGEVLQGFLVAAKGTGEKHKGCGFVEFKSAKGAQAAVKKLNGADIEGRKIKVA